MYLPNLVSWSIGNYYWGGIPMKITHYFLSLLPLLCRANDILGPYELPVEFWNASQNCIVVIRYNNEQYILGLRTDKTIDTIRLPILFKTTRNQIVPWFVIAAFQCDGNQINTEPLVVHKSVPRLCVTKAAIPPVTSFVPRYLPLIHINTYPDSIFPLEFSCPIDETSNYLISFRDH